MLFDIVHQAVLLCSMSGRLLLYAVCCAGMLGYAVCLCMAVLDICCAVWVCLCLFGKYMLRYGDAVLL